MPTASKMLAAAAAVSQASAAYQGFNYGATFTNGAIKQQQDYENEFKAAQALAGTNGAFSSARIYTVVQGDTPSDPIAAIPAAIKTKTSLLMGLWASAGDFAFNNEIMALQSAIKTYCNQGLGDLVAGISVGSEDLYRISPIGIAAKENPGASPDTLVSYIKKVRSTIKGTCLSDVSVGHVDTWTAYVNGSNSAVIENSDWLGMDAYPYFENTKPNDISDGKSLLQTALGNTEGVAMGKPVWITETGWPVSGKTSGNAAANTKNAKTYWDEVGCPKFGQQNVWWFTLQDAAPDTPDPSFGILSDLNGEPLYDLSCKGVAADDSTTSKSAHTSTKFSEPTFTSESNPETTSTSDSETTTKSETKSEVKTTSSSGPETTSESSSQTTSDSSIETTTAATSTTETSTTETSTTETSTTESSSTAVLTVTATDSVATTLATATPTSDSGSGSGSGSGSDSGSGSSSDSGSGSDSGSDSSSAPTSSPPPNSSAPGSVDKVLSLGALSVALAVTFAMF